MKMSFQNWMNRSEKEKEAPAHSANLFASPLPISQPSVFGAFGQSSSSTSTSAPTSSVFEGAQSSSSIFGPIQTGAPVNTTFSQDNSLLFGSARVAQSIAQTNVVGNSTPVFGSVAGQNAKNDRSSLFGKFRGSHSEVATSSTGTLNQKTVHSVFGDVQSTPSNFNVAKTGIAASKTSQQLTSSSLFGSSISEKTNPTNLIPPSMFDTGASPTKSIFGTAVKSTSLSTGSSVSNPFNMPEASSIGSKSRQEMPGGGSSSNQLKISNKQSFHESSTSSSHAPIYGKRRQHISEVTKKEGGNDLPMAKTTKTFGRARFGEAPTASYLQGIVQRKRSYDQDTTQGSHNLNGDISGIVGQNLSKKRLMQVSRNSSPHNTMLGGVKKRVGQQRGEDLQQVQHPLSRTRARKFSSSSSSLAEQAAALQSCSIICHDVPPDMINNKGALRNHFAKFGTILRFIVNAERSTASVLFKTHDEAAAAKTEGAYIEQSDSPMKIFFSKKARKSVDKSPTQDPESKRHPFQSGHRTLARVKTQQSQNPRFSMKNRALAPIFANTDEEKLAILEKIDNLLRKKVVRQFDIKKARTSKGTCPDMCPEKERYLRQQRKLLSVYEMEGGFVRHDKAIKEYSRSSADQEEPLSHELRPASVLQMTMHHILLEMMPRMNEGQIADWFDFVWNRTRAIRKELTIQQISDVTAVHINEECARFHIFCAHHLCEEDRMTFDPKINNENLEKTMKTVMDLYHDVYFSPSQGQPVIPLDDSNVAELYGYYILLNVNKTADVLNELQELPPEVRYSPDVGLAVEAFMAVHSNNYAKFFKVVRRATFMQGCILHRYFTQVRKRAALTIAKAFLPQANKRTVLFPVNDFMAVLGFNDMKELGIFCQHNGIEMDCNNMLILNRNGFEEAESSMVESRSNIVLDKIQGDSLAKIIAKRDISLIQHEPYSSFDKDGRYIGEHTALLSSEKMSGFQALPRPDISGQDKPVLKHTLPPGVTNEHIKVIARELFHEIIEESGDQIAKEMHKAATCTVIGKDLLEEILTSMILDIVSEANKETQVEKEKELKKKRELEEQRIREEMIKLEEKRKRDEKELQERLENERIAEKKKEMEIQETENIARQIQTEVENELISNTSKETYKEVLREHKINELSGNELIKITENVTSVLLVNICKKVYSDMKKKQCHSIFCEFQTRKLERLFSRWIKVKNVKVKFQNITTTFPSVPYSRRIDDQVKFLLPNQRTFSLTRKRSSFPLDNIAEASLRSPMDVMSSRKRCKTYFNATAKKLTGLYEKASKPLSFHDLLVNATKQKAFWKGKNEGSDVLWKIALHFPNNYKSKLLDWLHVAFLNGNDKVCIFEGNKVPRRDVCCYRTSNKTSKSDFMGTSSVVFALSKPPPSHTQQHWIDVRAELEFLISSRPSIPPISLVLILLNWDCEEEALGCQLGLPLLGFALSDWTLCSLCEGQENILENYNKLLNCVQFMFRSLPDLPSLITVNLRDFFESCLSSEYVTPLYHHVSQRLAAGCIPLDPASQIEFYNHVIDSLAGVACSEEFAEISWPPSEFYKSEEVLELPEPGWNSNESLSLHYDSMLRCKIPEFPNIDANVTESQIFDFALQYAEDVCPNCPTLLSAVKHSVCAELQRINDDFDLFSDSEFMDENLSLSNTFDWHKVIDCIISQHMTNLLYLTELGNTKITFPSDILESIEKHPGFDNSFSAVDFITLDTVTKRSKPIKKEGNSIPELDISSDVSKRRIADTTWMKQENVVTKTAKDAHNLHDKVKYDRKVNAEYGEKLKALLQEGEAPLGMLDSSIVSATILSSQDFSFIF